MSLTRLDCHFYQGKRINFDHSCFTAVNPDKTPGSLVIAGATAARESISSQVACKLAVERFVEGVFSFFDLEYIDSSDKSEQILESAFRHANDQVYHFGHKLAAGGRTAASLVGVVIQDDVISAGRVGGGAVYLFRDGEVMPFFAEQAGHTVLDSYLGAQPLVSVDIASIPAHESDQVYVLSEELNDDSQTLLARISSESSPKGFDPCEDIVHSIYREHEEVGFIAHAQIGPEAIYLDKRL